MDVRGAGLPSLGASVTALGVAVLAYGVASLLQAMAARRHPEAAAGRLVRSPLVLGGLALDVLGFAGGAVALHELPLFFVQGATSASIVVTALLASLVLEERPDRREAAAIPLVLAGLVALALAAEPGRATDLPAPLLVSLGAAAPLAAACGWWLVRRPGRFAGMGLAMLAGLSYGGASLLARAVSAPGAGWAGESPALVLLGLHALQGVVFVTAAMRHTSVTTGTAVLFVTETMGPAALGLLVLGDRIAPDTGLIAVAGCACLDVATGVLAMRPAGAVAPERPVTVDGGTPEPTVPEPGAVSEPVSVPTPRSAPDDSVRDHDVVSRLVVGRHAAGRHRRR